MGKRSQGGKNGYFGDVAGSIYKRVKVRWVAYAPTSRFTADGNADRVGVFGIFSPSFYRVGC